MNYNAYMQTELLLDDIDEIVNQLLWYLLSTKSVDNVEELYFAIKSIPEKITQIKQIIETELIENESYFESQDESQDI